VYSDGNVFVSHEDSRNELVFHKTMVRNIINFLRYYVIFYI
jgi:hypothetical protein